MRGWAIFVKTAWKHRSTRSLMVAEGNQLSTNRRIGSNWFIIGLDTFLQSVSRKEAARGRACFPDALPGWGAAHPRVHIGKRGRGIACRRQPAADGARAGEAVQRAA